MPYRPENELKRPDLKGEFLCGHCGKTFCHAASLNRHRLNFHGDDQMCLICNVKIPHNDTIRRHMQSEHNIQRVFTCGCCNWTFPDKKELHTHNQSMATTGKPGEASAIAVSSRKPGSLSQHELRGEERTPRAKKRSPKVESPMITTPIDENLLTLLSSIIQTLPTSLNTTESVGETSTPLPAPQSLVPESWMKHFLKMQPGLETKLPMIPSSSTSTVSSSSEMEVSKTPEPPLMSVLSSIMNNNIGEASTSGFDDIPSGAEEENIDESKDALIQAVGVNFLSIKTEQPTSSSMSSGPESGIGSESGMGSAPISHTPSPVSSSPISSEISPTSATDLIQMVQKAKRANKRRSIDDICSNLVVKKTCV